jgi:hypothetical protein
MKTVECTLISLYKFEVYYEEFTDKRYNWIIISDTLEGIIRGIVNRETHFKDMSMKDCRKFMYVNEYLMMPCNETRKGYHLWDIDEHDSAAESLNIDETWVECYFEGDIPKPVDTTFINGLLLNMIPHEEGEELAVYEFDFLLAEAIYKIAQTSRIKKEAVQKKLQEQEKLDAIGLTVITQCLDKEKKLVSSVRG